MLRRHTRLLVMLAGWVTECLAARAAAMHYKVQCFLCNMLLCTACCTLHYLHCRLLHLYCTLHANWNLEEAMEHSAHAKNLLS